MSGLRRFERVLVGRRTAVAVVCGVVALVTRLLYWFTTRSRDLTSDASSYHAIAHNIAEGRGFADTFPQLDLHHTAFRPPVYPFALSFVYRIFGATPGVGRAFAVITGVGVVLLTLYVVARHVGFLAGAVAAFAVAVFPPLIANDTVTLTEGFSLALLLLLVDRILDRRWATAGLLTGLLMLTRPSAQLLVLLVVAWLLAKAGRRAAIGALAVAAVVVVPWIVRNQVVLGSPLLNTSNGFNLAALYSPAAEDLGAFVDPVYDPSFDDMRLDQFDEAAWDRKLRQRALDNIRDRPFQVVEVVHRNVQAFFELQPSLNENAESIDGRNMKIRTYTLPLFYAMTVCGLFGLWWDRRSDIVKLLAAIAGLFTVASLFLVAPPRLRAPVDLVMCIGVGMLVASFLSRVGPEDEAQAAEERTDEQPAGEEPTDEEPTIDLRDEASPAVPSTPHRDTSSPVP